MVLFFVRFLTAFLVTLFVIVAALWYFRPSLSLMQSPTAEKSSLQAIYDQQNKGAEERITNVALSNVASDCLFFDARDNILPVDPMTQKLTAFYSKAAEVKASSKIENITFDGNKATITSVNHLTCKYRGKSTTVTTTTKDKWEKTENRWTCDTSKIIRTNNPGIGFVVPH